jgi:two-component system chemotaxis sensor kinase CheA
MNLTEVVREFLLESHENLDQLDRAFVELEKNPQDHENIAGIFRTIHTIKGTAGFLGFPNLERVAHAGETVLSMLRDGTLALDREITSALLHVVDVTRSNLDEIESTGAESSETYPELIAELMGIARGTSTAAAKPEAPTTPAPQAATPATPAAPAAPATPAAPAAPAAPETPAAAAQVPPAAPEAALVVSAAIEATPVADASLVVATATVPVPVAPPAIHVDDEGRETAIERREAERRGGDDRRHGITDSSLRVDVGLLDKLMNLVGELVLARNQILQFTATQTDSSFVGATQRLNLVTSELQEGVMKTRMQPIGNVWSKFPRVVRDVATICNKRVRLEMFGKDTELDKTIIEAIKDPLTHIVRNSVDHGIESPEKRAAMGKDPEGVLTLRAYHEGGQINIEIQDDGGGIEPERVRAKAVQRGLITAEQAAGMNEHEVIKLVFLPGFSTAEAITNVSGRGVGMDVVRTNIEKIGGTVDIQSRVGQGTTLRIKIPLTLAIIPALIVTSGGERFAIPQVGLVELVRLEGNQAQTGIEYIGSAPFYRLRGNLLPIVHLHRELGLEAAADEGVVSIVVLKADGRQFGLIVDAISDTEEIVVKPLGKQLKRVNVFAGATIMGDGRVALILDVPGLAQQARIISDMRDGALTEAAVSGPPASAGDDLRTMLLFRVGDRDQMAIPLSTVARLEEFSRSSIERSGDRDVVQYRGEILPLVSLPRYFGNTAALERDTLPVIVYAESGRSVGLVVEEIIDIVHESVSMSLAGSRPGVLGSAVIHQRVTDLLDVQAMMRAIDPSFLQTTQAA